MVDISFLTGQQTQNFDMKISNQDKDLLKLTNWKEYLTSRFNRTKYVFGSINSKNVYLHRLIMERVLGRKLDKKEKIDHINGDGTDNRRDNLRVCTHQENMGNQGKRNGGSSKYKGVTFWKRDNNWQARIYFCGKTIHLGYFSDEKEAADAYNKAAKSFFGEYAKLNNI